MITNLMAAYLTMSAFALVHNAVAKNSMCTFFDIS
ncbi:hypothetical protein C7M37_00493 [Lactiplantibacillus plantarum]|nr:hypothetical protein C7M37_00493 [Lactiplantibacillus plantarum]